MARKKLSFFSLVILIVAAIDNIRNLPAAALFGNSLVFFFLLAAALFLIPTALVAAELSATSSKEGGIYQWVHKAFGKKLAMLAIWLQWINTMIWYPAMLSFVAGTFAYLIDPTLVQNKVYLVGCILGVFWGLTWLNLKGLHISAMVNNTCALVGMVLPLLVLIGMGVAWVLCGKPLQMGVTPSAWVPSLSSGGSWVALVVIMASFLGMELSGVHVHDIRDPQRNFPKAVLVAALFIFFSMLLGSLAIAFVLPPGEIQLIAGVMQVLSDFFAAFGLSEWLPVMTLLVVLGSIGGMINWLIAPAKGLLHAAESGFLPLFFRKKNRAGVAHRILLMQGGVVSLLCLLFLLQESVNASFWFLTALSTELYMFMYMLMFAAAIRLRRSGRPGTGFQIPGNLWGLRAVALLGVLGCCATVVVSFIPPEHVHFENPSRYFLMIALGTVLAISPVFLFYRNKR